MSGDGGLRTQFDATRDLLKGVPGFETASKSFFQGAKETLGGAHTTVRDMFEQGSEMMDFFRTLTEEFGAEAIGGALTGGVGYATGDTVLAGLFGSGVELGTHWMGHVLGQKGEPERGDWVIIDNDYRPAMWDEKLKTWVPRKLENDLDHTFGKVAHSAVTQGGFSGNNPEDVMTFGASNTTHKRSYSYGFMIGAGIETNTYEVFNFQFNGVQTLKKTLVARVPDLKANALDSDRAISDIREGYLRKDGFGLDEDGFDDYAEEDSINLETGATVIPNKFPNEEWSVVKRMGPNVLCRNTTRGSDREGQETVFSEDSLNNGSVLHRRKWREYHEEENIVLASWTGGNEARFQVGGLMWVAARVGVKERLGGKLVPNKAKEIKDELAIVTKIFKGQTHFTMLIDGEKRKFRDIQEMKEFASPLSDAERALLRKLQVFNQARNAVMSGNDIQPVTAYDTHTQIQNLYLCVFLDYIDPRRSEFANRWLERQPPTRTFEVDTGPEVFQDLGVQTRGKIDGGKNVSWSMGQGGPNKYDWKEEMHAKGFAAGPVDMDWKPPGPEVDTSLESSNGMAISVGLIAAALILAYS